MSSARRHPLLARLLRAGMMCFVALSVSFICLSEAGAWLLPARPLLRRAASALPDRATAPGLEVTLTGRARRADAGPEATMAVSARWLFGAGPAATQLVMVAAGGKPFAWTPGAAAEAAAPAAPAGSGGPSPTAAERIVLPLLFGARDPDLLARTLGVDVSVRSLGLLGDLPCDVLGAQPGDDAAAQIWFDHRDFRPVRVVIAAPGAGAARLDLLDWRDEPHGVPFPRAIRVYEGNRWVRMYDVDPARARGVAAPSSGAAP